VTPRSHPLPSGAFVNPIAEGADPHVVRDGRRYLWCQSEGNTGVAIWESDRLTSFGTKHVVWTAPAQGPYSRQVWAPELHHLDGRWYVYVAASDGDNASHRAYVLASDSDDPLGSYTLHGPLDTGDGTGPVWAIDMTVLQHGSRRYAVWSGWPNPDTPSQFLYIGELTTPVTLSGRRVRLCANDDFVWERTEETAQSPGLNEAPQGLMRAGKTFVVYSCATSLLPTYKLGLLELVGPDPLDPAHWCKWPAPVFASGEQTFGVGHGTFVTTPDEAQWWHVYHAKLDRRPGWRRAVYVQPMAWDGDGRPNLGAPVAAGQGLAVPAGTPVVRRDRRASWDLRGGWASVRDFDFYGHHQFVRVDEAGVHLGAVPSAPVNAYRCGEKLVLRDGRYRDLRAEVVLRYLDGDRGVGMLLRVTGPAVGYDAQRGYFAGISPRRRLAMVGKMDGSRWRQLATAPWTGDVSRAVLLSVDALGDTVTMYVDGSSRPLVRATDSDYPVGSVGMRVVDTHAVFSNFTVDSR
jgi:GH43 family beta-xylosidase